MSEVNMEGLQHAVANACKEMDLLRQEKRELLQALKTWMKYFHGNHEDVMQTIAEDGSTLEDAQAVTRDVLAKVRP